MLKMYKTVKDLYSHYYFADDLRVIALNSYLRNNLATTMIGERIIIATNYGDTIPKIDSEFEVVELSIYVDHVKKASLIYSEVGFDLRQTKKKEELDQIKFIAHSSVISNYAEKGQTNWKFKHLYKTSSWVKKTIKLEAIKILSDAKTKISEKPKINALKR